jgi:foldase protein PrsA
MPNVSRVRAARALGAAALVGAALTLSACVSDSSGSAFSAPAPSPTAGVAAPTVPAVPTMPPIPRNKPAAVVAGTPISGAAYADTVVAVRKAAAAQQMQQQPTEKQIRSIALNNLIDRAVIRLYARRHGITVTPAQVQSLFDQYQAYYGGPISFTNTLKDNGLTVAGFKAELPDRILQGKVEQRVAPLPATVEEVDARHILVRSRTLADTLYAQLKRDPHKFAALARKYSIDTQSAQAGGELGFFARGAMVAAFERAAFSQRIGVIGKPVKSTYGYHIILFEAHKNVPVAQAGQQMQQTLQQRQQNDFSQWLSAERKRDHVQILAKGV